MGERQRRHEGGRPPVGRSPLERERASRGLAGAERVRRCRRAGDPVGMPGDRDGSRRRVWCVRRRRVCRQRPVALADVIDIVDNLTYRINRALSSPVRERRLHPRSDFT